MKRLWKSLALSLGLTITAPLSRGQDVPAATLGRPVAQLGRPVVQPQEPTPPVYDPRLQPVGFNDPTVIRAAAPDPAPVVATGRPVEVVSPTMFGYRNPADEDGPKPMPAGPPLAPAGPVSPGAAIAGPIVVDGQPTGGDCPCSTGGIIGPRRWLSGNGMFGCGCDHSWSLLDSCDCPAPINDRLWLRAEYLAWFTKGYATPPLITQGTLAQGTTLQGALIPGTTVLFGGDDVSGGLRSGARFSGGYWFTDDHLIGIDASFFFLGSKDATATFGNDGTNPNAQIARPVTFTTDGLPHRELVAGQQTNPNVPGLVATLAGVATVNTSSSELWGAEVNLRTNLVSGPVYTLDLIGGFRMLNLTEGLSVSENLTITNTTPAIAGAVGTNFAINDSFDTKNRFYGGQLGLANEWRRGRWSLDLDAKIGLGMTEQTADINGLFTTTPAPGFGAPTTVAGGLLTRAGTAGNIGHFTRDQFSIVPEVGLTVGYQLTQHVRLFAGYNFLYWSGVARPGQQIDTVVDPNQIAVGGNNPTGANRPTFAFHNSDFWAQGVNVGVEFRW